MVQCTAKDLIGKYVGSTEDIVREKLNEARGGVLLIDEVRMNTQFWMAYGCFLMFLSQAYNLSGLYGKDAQVLQLNHMLRDSPQQTHL